MKPKDTLADTLRLALPEGEHYVTLTRPDGRSAQVIVCIEHGRVYVSRLVEPYRGAGIKVWHVYHWTDTGGDWFTNHVPGTAKFDHYQSLAQREPTVVSIT